jgi:hypothetical protein
MNPELTADGLLRIGNTLLDTAAASELIHRLAEIRAQMHPPIPQQWAPGDTIGLVDKPAFKVLQTTEGLMLAFRHDGFGWCCFDLRLEDAALLRDFIGRRTAHISGPGLEDATGSSH